jgi:hypothetical protein
MHAAGLIGRRPRTSGRHRHWVTASASEPEESQFTSGFRQGRMTAWSGRLRRPGVSRRVRRKPRHRPFTYFRSVDAKWASKEGP